MCMLVLSFYSLPSMVSMVQRPHFDENPVLGISDPIVVNRRTLLVTVNVTEYIIIILSLTFWTCRQVQS